MKAALSARIRACFFGYGSTAAEKLGFNGEDRYVPVAYKEQSAILREVAEKSGAPFNTAACEAGSKRETDAPARRRQQTQPPAAPKP